MFLCYRVHFSPPFRCAVAKRAGCWLLACASAIWNEGPPGPPLVVSSALCARIVGPENGCTGNIQDTYLAFVLP